MKKKEIKNNTNGGIKNTISSIITKLVNCCLDLPIIFFLVLLQNKLNYGLIEHVHLLKSIYDIEYEYLFDFAINVLLYMTLFAIIIFVLVVSIVSNDKINSFINPYKIGVFEGILSNIFTTTLKIIYHLFTFFLAIFFIYNTYSIKLINPIEIFSYRIEYIKFNHFYGIIGILILMRFLIFLNEISNEVEFLEETERLERSKLLREKYN